MSARAAMPGLEIFLIISFSSDIFICSSGKIIHRRTAEILSSGEHRYFVSFRKIIQYYQPNLTWTFPNLTRMKSTERIRKTDGEYPCRSVFPPEARVRSGEYFSFYIKSRSISWAILYPARISRFPQSRSCFRDIFPLSCVWIAYRNRGICYPLWS